MPKKPFADTRLAKFIEKRVMELKPRKSQIEIAVEAGFVSVNMLPMLKGGSSKLPLDRVPSLARARMRSGLSPAPDTRADRGRYRRPCACRDHGHPGHRQRTWLAAGDPRGLGSHRPAHDQPRPRGDPGDLRVVENEEIRNPADQGGTTLHAPPGLRTRNPDRQLVRVGGVPWDHRQRPRPAPEASPGAAAQARVVRHRAGSGEANSSASPSVSPQSRMDERARTCLRRSARHGYRRSRR